MKWFHKWTRTPAHKRADRRPRKSTDRPARKLAGTVSRTETRMRSRTVVGRWARIVVDMPIHRRADTSPHIATETPVGTAVRTVIHKRVARMLVDRRSYTELDTLARMWAGTGECRPVHMLSARRSPGRQADTAARTMRNTQARTLVGIALLDSSWCTPIGTRKEYTPIDMSARMPACRRSRIAADMLAGTLADTEVDKPARRSIDTATHMASCMAARTPADRRSHKPAGTVLRSEADTMAVRILPHMPPDIRKTGREIDTVRGMLVGTQPRTQVDRPLRTVAYKPARTRVGRRTHIGARLEPDTGSRTVARRLEYTGRTPVPDCTEPADFQGSGRTRSTHNKMPSGTRAARILVSVLDGRARRARTAVLGRWVPDPRRMVAPRPCTRAEHTATPPAALYKVPPGRTRCNMG